MNLTKDSWIPVQGQGRISLLELFSDNKKKYKRLHGNSVEKIVIFRLLLSLVHAAVSIKNTEEWLSMTTEKISIHVVNYLQEHSSQFELYGDNPFLQFPSLAKGSPKKLEIGSTQYHVATGNSVLISDKNREPELSDAEKVICLLQASCYGCGGKKYDKTILLSSGHNKMASGRCGTLLGFIGYLHTLLLGEDIIDSLRLNLLTEEDIGKMGTYPLGTGHPFWENMPKGEICERAQEYTKTYQGQLFPLDKFLLIQNDQIIMTEGIIYPSLKEGLIDPGLTLIKDKKQESRALWARSEKKPWRELNAILAFLNEDTPEPRFISLGLEKISREKPRKLTIWLGGLEVSSNSGEQKVKGNNDYVESEFTFQTDSMNGEAQGHFSNLMKELDDYSKRLYASVRQYFTQLNDQKADEQAKQATQEFWTVAERSAGKIIDAAFSPDDRTEECSELKKKWKELAISLYDKNCPRFSPREILAWAKCRPLFKNTQSH